MHLAQFKQSAVRVQYQIKRANKCEAVIFGADMSHVSARTSGYAKLMGGLVLAMLLCVPLARAQQAAHGEAMRVYLYRGVDRDQRLIEKARQEGTLVLCMSLATTESMPLTKPFEKKYGIKVELWRAISDKVVQRVIAEGQAKRFAVDVIETNGPELEMIVWEKLPSQFFIPYFADLPTSAIPAHRP
jgi:iron(III) transport system substrate-binding protein